MFYYSKTYMFAPLILTWPLFGRNAGEFSQSQGGLEWTQHSVNRDAYNWFLLTARNAREFLKSHGGLWAALPSINQNAFIFFLHTGRNAREFSKSGCSRNINTTYIICEQICFF